MALGVRRFQGILADLYGFKDVWFNVLSLDFDNAIWAVPHNGAPRRIAPAPGGDAFSMESDGVTMAWIEGTGRLRPSPNPDPTFTRVDLYESPARPIPRAFNGDTSASSRTSRRTPPTTRWARVTTRFSQPRRLVPAQPSRSFVFVMARTGGSIPAMATSGWPTAPVWIADGGSIALTQGFLVAPRLPQSRVLQRIRLDSLGTPEGFVRPD